MCVRYVFYFYTDYVLYFFFFFLFFFFFNDTATTEIYTLSLHDALPILLSRADFNCPGDGTMMLDGKASRVNDENRRSGDVDRKSTRLNSSHSQISYAVFCLKKKKKKKNNK